MKPEADLAERLDDCIEWARRGEAIEEILQDHPDVADELLPLLTLAADLERLPEPTPSVEGVMRTMVNLSTQQTAPEPTPVVRRVGWFSRSVWARAAIIMLAVSVLGWGTVSASAQAVPGDLLYPIKLFTERARFFLTINAENKAELRIAFSAERLKEAVRKYEGGGGLDRILLNEMLDEAKLAVESAPTLAEPVQGVLIAQAAHLSDFQRDTLARLERRAQPQERQTIQRFQNMCGRRGAWMRQMLPDDATPRRAAPQQQQQRIRRWRSMCPMW